MLSRKSWGGEEELEATAAVPLLCHCAGGGVAFLPEVSGSGTTEVVDQATREHVLYRKMVQGDLREIADGSSRYLQQLDPSAPTTGAARSDGAKDGRGQILDEIACVEEGHGWAEQLGGPAVASDVRKFLVTRLAKYPCVATET